ncbi:MAG TPA: ribosome recycling factor [Phaeodactylibacter sp.]|nr:ribosome recycling factor [Phaeodactylibacter sp.]
MQEDAEQYVSEAESSMQKSLGHLKQELAKIRAGKASPDMLSGIVVPYYGNQTPLNQVANITSSDSRTLVIQPWEKSMIAPIEKAIFEANLGLTPQNDGDLVRINIPPLTEERRKQLVKQAKNYGEETKVSLRSARRDAMEHLKKAIKEGYPEDAGKRLEDEVESLTKSYSNKVDATVEAKEKDIMTL